MGRIVKLGPGVAAGLLAILFSLGSLGCGSSKSSTPPPTITVSLSPSPNASLNLGETLQFTANVLQGRTTITTPISFFSSNKKVLSLSPSGLACAGTWDANFIVCSPGPAGVVQVTAAGYGTASIPTTVYVHPQVTSIEVSAINPPSLPASAPCVSQKQTENFQATVFSNGADITPGVGPLNWSVVDPGVAKVSTTATGLAANQGQIIAAQPGLTHVFASTSGVNSNSAAFETCRVQSLTVVANATGSDSITMQAGTNAAMTAAGIDSQGASISVGGVQWISSQPGAASVRSGSVSAIKEGGAAVFPTCTPPTCNVNLYPVYPSDVVKVTVTGTTGASNVYVTSTGCGTTAGCKTSVVPIDTQTNTAGAALTLASAPNSFVLDATGNNGYFGSQFGLQVLAPAGNTLQVSNSIKGKVLAVSPDGTLVVISDTVDSPNIVNIFNHKSGSNTQLLLSGVTAAAFSSDSTTAFLIAGSKLYEYSTTHPLQTSSLGGSATDAAFLTTGAFGFVAGAPSTVSLFNTCDGAAPQSPNTATVSTTTQPTLIAPLPSGTAMAAVDSPGFSLITVNTSAAGCPPPVTASAAFHDFGQGSFTASQILVSSDGSRLYVISNLPTVLVYDFASASAFTIPLNPSSTPLSAALTVSGHDLYVGASDGTVHHLDTTNLSDVGQIAVTLCSTSGASCPPNLMALKP